MATLFEGNPFWRAIIPKNAYAIIITSDMILRT
jgi:hypothetical protein